MFYGEKKARTVDEDLRGVLTAAIDKALADTATPDAASAAAAPVRNEVEHAHR